MEKRERKLLEVLKAELVFLEKGGYSGSVRQPWRYQLFFEDSPTCTNYSLRVHSEPCSECVLMPAVPAALRGEKIPCRHIPLNEEGETLDSLYRYADRPEIEEVFGTWLRSAISKLEEEDQRLGPVAAQSSHQTNLPSATCAVLTVRG